MTKGKVNKDKRRKREKKGRKRKEKREEGEKGREERTFFTFNLVDSFGFFLLAWYCSTIWLFSNCTDTVSFFFFIDFSLISICIIFICKLYHLSFFHTFRVLSVTHTHTHTHIYIYIYICCRGLTYDQNNRLTQRVY